MTEPRVVVDLSQDEAIVLFEWVARLNASEEREFEDQAEQRVLWDLESVLETKIDSIFSAAYEQRVELARDRVRDVEE